ncbi:hypothetical protein JTE90_026771 [Oedothorax gibbosus]|uniref:Uncharacterized protein n=1 Tax=Oedothorax gibbosus TaxID=931172 RepID=A0AAV6TN64_9ARAC|nr:hypothetical protein JTE90_026771 [Oedothorax gibbosus]
METTDALEVENPSERVKQVKEKAIESPAIETPAIETPALEVANAVTQSENKTKPLVGILKKKKPSSEKVMGVKSLESSFVKGDVLK